VQAQQLAHRYGLRSLRHIEPPMGFINDPEAVEACLRFIEAQSPFRFCFLALGCPQQEILANKLRERGIARGLTLCIGASIDFMTGVERRAPQWMQRAALEWAFRLLQDPRHMAGRYLLRGPRIFRLLKHIKFELLSSRDVGASLVPLVNPISESS
jgi:exopolysaccharide biosynthesis WecB/TagA/CpsF family protein